VLSKTELARFLIGLVEVGDADFIDQDSLLPAGICATDDRAVVRRLRDLIQSLYRDFDYRASPEFAALSNGKSDAYRTMLAKVWNDPEKQTQMRKKYADALAVLLSDNRAYKLTMPQHHKILDDLRAGFRTVMNPDNVA
jgi:hypothetical protein